MEITTNLPTRKIRSYVFNQKMALILLYSLLVYTRNPKDMSKHYVLANSKHHRQYNIYAARNRDSIYYHGKKIHDLSCVIELTMNRIDLNKRNESEYENTTN